MCLKHISKDSIRSNRALINSLREEVLLLFNVNTLLTLSAPNTFTILGRN